MNGTDLRGAYCAPDRRGWGGCRAYTRFRFCRPATRSRGWSRCRPRWPWGGADRRWDEHGPRWIEQLAGIAAEVPRFTVRYRHLVATDRAVIAGAVADPAGPVNAIRSMLRARLALPPQTRNIAELVHTMVFRYRPPLVNPRKQGAALSLAGP